MYSEYPVAPLLDRCASLNQGFIELVSDANILIMTAILCKDSIENFSPSLRNLKFSTFPIAKNILLFSSR